jgi:hypothetical protein
MCQMAIGRRPLKHLDAGFYVWIFYIHIGVSACSWDGLQSIRTWWSPNGMSLAILYLGGGDTARLAQYSVRQLLEG